MLITRPFTNEEVASKLEALNQAFPFNSEYRGVLAEASRRLRGEAGSGEEERPAANPKLLKLYADWASAFAAIYKRVPTPFDVWCTTGQKTPDSLPLPVIDPKMLEVGK